MVTKAKKSKSQTSDFFSNLSKIAENFSYKHLDKIINREDTPQVVSIFVVFVIFLKVLPIAKEEKSLILGLPFWLIFVLLIVLVLIIVGFVFKRNQS